MGVLVWVVDFRGKAGGSSVICSFVYFNTEVIFFITFVFYCCLSVRMSRWMTARECVCLYCLSNSCAWQPVTWHVNKRKNTYVLMMMMTRRRMTTTMMMMTTTTTTMMHVIGLQSETICFFEHSNRITSQTSLWRQWRDRPKTALNPSVYNFEGWLPKSIIYPSLYVSLLFAPLETNCPFLSDHTRY